MRNFTKLLLTVLSILFFYVVANAQQQQAGQSGAVEKISRKAIKKVKAKTDKKEKEGDEENDKYDGPAKAEEFQINRTKNPATGQVPAGKMWEAVMQTQQKKDI
jgi:hypothetical protein